MGMGGIWFGITWVGGGIWNVLAWILIGLWNILVFLFGWLVALMISILTVVIIPIFVGLVANDAVGNQRILAFKGLYAFLEKGGVLRKAKEGKQPSRPLEWSAPSFKSGNEQEQSQEDAD